MTSPDHAAALELLRTKIRSIPDFPSPGIVFRDITPLLADATAFRIAVDLHIHHVRDRVGELDLVVGIESRGFLFGSVIADRLGLGFVPVRKPGKLPAATIVEAYALEYGSNSLEVHFDAVSKGARVLIVDDLLATGGTARAAANLVERLGGRVESFLFLVELSALDGRAKLTGTRVEAILRF